jgi:type II secretory ATPase GspE/PulE/Tfp pilus assembly ATPase PilB-like protein
VTFTSTRAKSAAEALLKLLGAASDKATFIKFVNLVVNMRLVRRLCEGCKMPFQPTVQVLHQLQLPPDRVPVLYQEYHPPPVDPNAPKNQQNLPPPVCPRCGGLGYMGRIGMFEMLVVDDNIRQALAQQPSADIVQQLAVKAGMNTLREEGIALLAQGITSIPELQRALQ